MTLEHQLANYVLDVQSHEAFRDLKGLGDLCSTMVEEKKHITYPLVFKLLKLALILPVSTATVERAFSAMNIVKSRLRNRMCDSFLNDCLVCYIEKDVFDSISNESIMQRFQCMKSRRGQL
uniref:HAT C-terminal dimerisation domain-containing protein n=1 Tax=Opuntia streptacantha TaxID=393608 RepID=A0A7C9A4N8_OPUST